MGVYTTKDLANEFGVTEWRICRRIRAFATFYNIPREKILRKEKGVYKYVLDEKLYREFKKFCQPKIRIEVKVQ